MNYLTRKEDGDGLLNRRNILQVPVRDNGVVRNAYQISLESREWNSGNTKLRLYSVNTKPSFISRHRTDLE